MFLSPVKQEPGTGYLFISYAPGGSTFLDRNPSDTLNIKASPLVKGLFVNETWCNGTLQCE